MSTVTRVSNTVTRHGGDRRASPRSAVDIDHGAGRVRRGIAGEVEGGADDFVRLAAALESDALPALEHLWLNGIRASATAKATVRRAGLVVW